MLKILIATLTNNLSSQKFSRRCQDRVDPELGDMAEIHDRVEFEPIARAAELQQHNDIWLSDELPDTHSISGIWCDEALAFDSLQTINPANGLPMMDGILDVAGNVYGMDDCGADFHSDLI